MVIDAGTAAAGAFRGGRQPANITPIIFRPKQRDIIGRAHAGVVEILHLLVEAPHLRHVGHVGVHLLAQDVALHADDFFKQGAVRLRAAGRHLGIVGPAQAQCNNALVIPVSPDAFAPEIL